MSLMDKIAGLRKAMQDPFGSKENGNSESGDMNSIDSKNKEVLNGFLNLNQALGINAERTDVNERNMQRLRKESSGL